MKKIILKLISIIILILSSILIILNSKDLTIHFINLFNYQSTLDKKIILIGILRIILKILIIIYSLIVMLLQVKIIKNNEINKYFMNLFIIRISHSINFFSCCLLKTQFWYFFTSINTFILI